VRSYHSSTPLVCRRLLGGDEGAPCTCPPRGRRGGNAGCGSTAASSQRGRTGFLVGGACAPPLERSDVREVFPRLILRHAPLDGMHHNIPRSNARTGEAIIIWSLDEILGIYIFLLAHMSRKHARMERVRAFDSHETQQRLKTPRRPHSAAPCAVLLSRPLHRESHRRV